MWFLTAGPVVSIPKFPERNSLTKTVASSLVCTSPLAVITVVGLLDVLMVSTSAGLRSLLLTICILAPESATNSLCPPALLLTQPEYPFFRGRVECSFVVLFELVYVFGKIPSLASGTSLLSFSLFTGPILKFHSAGTLLIRIFVLYFSKRWSFLFPDTRLTQRGLSEAYPSNWFQDFLHRVSPGLSSTLRNQCFRVLRDATQLWYNFHIIVVAFSSFLGIAAFLWLLVWLFVNLMCRKQTFVSSLTTRFILIELALRRVPIFTRRPRAGMVTFASDTSLPRHTKTSRHGGLGRRGGSVFGFLRMIVTLMPETALVSFRTLAFFFPLVTGTFSSCNAD